MTEISAYNAILGRAAFAAKLGMQFGGKRDIYQTLGYSKDLTFADFYAQYERHDIAAAIVDRPVDATWRGPLELLEPDNENETKLEKAWHDLERRLKLKSRLVRLDKLTSLGHYGVLLLGLSDISTKTDYMTPVEGNVELLYVKPLGEGSAKINSYEDDPADERYGMPKYYDITVADKSQNSTSQLLVHHSRVLHVTADLLESEEKGIPVLKKVFNRLQDLEKIVGGSAEMYWKGARPGYAGKMDKDAATIDKDLEKELKDQITEYDHGLRRFLVAEGLNLESLAQQIADPSNHVDVQIQMISAITGIPKRILTGSERGELASSQDKERWLEMIYDRRQEYAESSIIYPLVERLMKYGILPESENYYVKWRELFSISEQEQVEIGAKRAGALKEYMQNPMAESIVPPDAFIEYFLGLTEEQKELIKKMQTTATDEDQEL